jgi:hypothetical protein
VAVVLDLAADDVVGATWWKWLDDAGFTVTDADGSVYDRGDEWRKGDAAEGWRAGDAPNDDETGNVGLLKMVMWPEASALLLLSPTGTDEDCITRGDVRAAVDNDFTTGTDRRTGKLCVAATDDGVKVLTPIVGVRWITFVGTEDENSCG